MDWGKTGATMVEQELEKPDCVMLQFINPPAIGASNFRELKNHSIVVWRNCNGLFYFDTAYGIVQKGPSQLKDFGSFGDAYIVAKNPFWLAPDAKSETAGSLAPSAPEHKFPTNN